MAEMNPTIHDSISIVIADDHAVVRQGVRAFLETQPGLSIAGEADSGEAAVLLCTEHAPDVVLMDLLMPGLGGVEATRRIKQVSPRTQIVVLTSYHEDSHLLSAVRAGALSYLLKDVSPPELLAAVRKAARGEATLHPRIATKLIEALREQTTMSAPDPFAELSHREMDVLRLIAEGISNAEMAERLFISEKTVKSHVSNILGKLHLTDRTQAAVLAWRKGFVKPEK
jgi:NarL family two-component system response regulator LiaR